MENKNKNFLRIPNKFFILDENNMTIFHQIKSEGFTLWAFLLMCQGANGFTQTSIKKIKSFLHRKEDDGLGLSDTRTIRKYLIALKELKMIECEQLNSKTRADDELLFQVNSCLEEKEGHQQISAQFLIDRIGTYGHTGWTIYCMLFQYHNQNYGNSMSGNYGFADCSEDFMESVIKKDRKTISKYIQFFKKSDVKVESQPCITIYNATTAKYEQKYMPNHYFVWAKYDSSNKYSLKM